MLELENKYGDPPEKMPVEVKNYLTQLIQTVRLSVHKSYVMLCSIQPSFKEKEEKKDKDKLEKSYLNLKNKFILDRESLEDYVVCLNKILVNEVIQNLLRSSQDLISEVYNE